MSVVWKYPLKGGDVVNVDMPANARILTAQCQTDTLCLWALVDPEQAPVTRTFRVAGTGQTIPPDSFRNYIGSAQMFGGALVWHVFEEFPA